MADYGQIAANIADAAAGAAYAILMAYIADNYIDLANDYYDLYKHQRQFYYDNFQQQGELPLNNELYGVPFYLPLYNQFATYTSNGVVTYSSLYYFQPELNQVKGDFAEYFGNHLRMMNSQDMSPIVPSKVDLAEIADDWLSYFFRYEEHRRDVYNERRWAQRMDSTSYGVKEGAQVQRGLATGFMAFDEAQGQLVSSVNSLANGYFEHSAYTKVQNETIKTPSATPDRIFASNFDAQGS